MVNYDRIKSLYSDAFKQHGDSPSSVLWPKGKQDLRFGHLTQHILKSPQPFTIMDYGCGLAHLYDFLTEQYSSFQYVGVEIVDDFINFCRTKTLNHNFSITHEDAFWNNPQKYDYIVCSGTFNVLYSSKHSEHQIIFHEKIQSLFDKCEKFLSFNLMTTHVDYIQEGAFHVNPTDILDFCMNNLSRRVLLDSTYMPYEYTVTVFKDQNCIQEDRSSYQTNWNSL